MSEDNLIQFGILIVGLIGIYLTMIAAVKKGNKDAIKETVDKIKDYDALEKRVSLVEQKVNLCDDDTRRELIEIKKLLTGLNLRMNEHIEKLHTGK